MPFIDLTELPDRKLLEGVEVKFVHSENMTLAYWTFQAGANLPEHSHPHEQVANLIEGEFGLQNQAREDVVVLLETLLCSLRVHRLLYLTTLESFLT